MRIIPDDVKPVFVDEEDCALGGIDQGFRISDTIEIQDNEWEDIYDGYTDLLCDEAEEGNTTKPFTQFAVYLKQLIQINLINKSK